MCVTGAVVSYFCVASLSTSIGKRLCHLFSLAAAQPAVELRPANQAPRQDAMAALGLALVLGSFSFSAPAP